VLFVAAALFNHGGRSLSPANLPLVSTLWAKSKPGPALANVITRPKRFWSVDGPPGQQDAIRTTRLPRVCRRWPTESSEHRGINP